MTITIKNPQEKTLGEFLKNRFPDFKIWGGCAPLNMDISHGIEYEYSDNREHGRGESLTVYPFVKWTDGGYKPCHYWGRENYLILEK